MVTEPTGANIGRLHVAFEYKVRLDGHFAMNSPNFEVIQLSPTVQ